MILPWQVDVPQDRWPVMNWLVIAATVAVFGLQVRDSMEHRVAQRPGVYHVPNQGVDARPQADRPPEPSVRDKDMPGGITGEFMLQGWSLKGLLGHMWLHGGLLHLLGNMWFLWLFGNAVCAKIGNFAYLFLYVLFGIASGATHLLTVSGPVIGASGAINGVVGMYLVLFYDNDITCYFIWLPFIRRFDVSSFWMILYWLFWDVAGALFLGGISRVAYFAHLGGFATGFGLASLLVLKGWITMTWYEKSLWQAWQHRRADKSQLAAINEGRSAPATPSEPAQQTPEPLPVPEPKPIRMLDLDSGKTERRPQVAKALHVTCSCGKRIALSRQYAGKSVLCPRCRAKLDVPQAGTPEPRTLPTPPIATPTAKSHDDGTIRFACHCGRKIKAPARYAGKSGKCPQCGNRIRVPRPPGTAASESA
jgi:membrane associated rhomboid family serine protease/predicted RNA-binding Zn-ribbon protein involved in translation (DUF1610 family)